MRTGTNSRGFVEVKIVELSTINCEVLGSWSNDSMRRSSVKKWIGILSPTNNQSISNLSFSILNLINLLVFNTGKNVICDLEVNQPDITNFACDGTISVVLPSGKVDIVCSHERILMIRIFWLVVVVDNWFARVFPWHLTMEDS